MIYITLLGESVGGSRNFLITDSLSLSAKNIYNLRFSEVFLSGNINQTFDRALNVKNFIMV
jgi:hypothetical protein